MEWGRESTYGLGSSHTVLMGSQTLDLSNRDLLKQPISLKLPEWDWVEGRYAEQLFWAEWSKAIGCTTFLLEGRMVETDLVIYFTRWGLETFFFNLLISDRSYN